MKLFAVGHGDGVLGALRGLDGDINLLDVLINRWQGQSNFSMYVVQKRLIHILLLARRLKLVCEQFPQIYKPEALRFFNN